MHRPIDLKIACRPMKCLNSLMYFGSQRWFVLPIFPVFVSLLSKDPTNNYIDYIEYSIHLSEKFEITLIFWISVYCWKCLLTSIIACNGFNNSPYWRFSANFDRFSIPPTKICKWFNVVIAEMIQCFNCQLFEGRKERFSKCKRTIQSLLQVVT